MQVEFYQTAAGHIPVQNFIESLNVKAQAKVARSLDLLEEFGLRLGQPHFKRIVGREELWELRTRLASDNFRILLFPAQGDKLILLHGFAKKTDKVAKRDLEIAEARMRDHMGREKK